MLTEKFYPEFLWCVFEHSESELFCILIIITTLVLICNDNNLFPNLNRNFFRCWQESTGVCRLQTHIHKPFTSLFIPCINNSSRSFGSGKNDQPKSNTRTFNDCRANCSDFTCVVQCFLTGVLQEV